MCGILGYWSKHNISDQTFKKNLEKLHHRGPDNISLKRIGNLLLGHTRLAIIDLNQISNQPMQSFCGRYEIIFNGEIYNFLNLKKQLKSYNFSTHSDTEVLLASYIKWGHECLSKLNGMFALAIYDKKNNNIFLARDRIGKKPLFYSYSKHSFLFSSEIKSLIDFPEIKKDLDIDGMNLYFSKGYIGSDKTLFKNIKQLPSGSYINIDLNNIKVSKPIKFWKLPKLIIEQYSEKKIIDDLDELLTDSIQQRMQSDVNLGVFLSGGLDSSLITAIASKAVDKQISTYTIGFMNSYNDESKYARYISKFFKTYHIEYFIKQPMINEFETIVDNLDQPFADSSIFPMYQVSKEARKDITVALSGDGGDELFSGYSHYDSFDLENKIRNKIPYFYLKILSNISQFLPNRQKFDILKRFRYDTIFKSFSEHSSRFFNEFERMNLFSNDHNFKLNPDYAFEKMICPNADWISNVTKIDFQNYLVDDILVKVDRMSMLNSLEIRCPLLDYRIAELTFKNIKSNLKRQNDVKKYILKQLAKRYLPKNFNYERKHGFGVPLSSWFDEALSERLKQIFHRGDSGYLKKAEVFRYIKLHKTGVSNYSKKLFSILMWEEWYQRFYKQYT